MQSLDADQLVRVRPNKPYDQDQQADDLGNEGDRLFVAGLEIGVIREPVSVAL